SRSPTHFPIAPPNWISGPSRPSDPPEAIASHDAADFCKVTRIGRSTLPSATASITLPTPPLVRRPPPSRPTAPPPKPPSAGNPPRAQPGAARIADTTSLAPTQCSTAASEARKPTAKAAAATATSPTPRPNRQRSTQRSNTRGLYHRAVHRTAALFLLLA